jgi:hypothetical protein
MALQRIIDQYSQKKGDLYDLIERYIDPTNGRFTENVYRILGNVDARHIRFQKAIQQRINQLQPEDRVNPDLLFAKQDYEEAFDELEHALQRGVVATGGRKTRKTSRKRKSKHTRSKKV